MVVWWPCVRFGSAWKKFVFIVVGLGVVVVDEVVVVIAVVVLLLVVVVEVMW